MASKKPTPDQSTHDPEVRPKAARTHWSARDRLRLLAAADACAPGELGALRREGIYSSPLARWRRQRAEGELAALTPKRKAAPTPEAQRQTAELARLRRENQRLQAKLAQAEVIIDVQKKLATLLGITLPAPPPDA